MPAQKRQWVLGPDGQLVEKGAKVARRTDPVRGNSERLSDGLSRGGYGVSGSARPSVAQLAAARTVKPWLAELGLSPRPRAPGSTGGSSAGGGSAGGSSAGSAHSSAAWSAQSHAGSTSSSLAEQYQRNAQKAEAAAAAAAGSAGGGRVRQRPTLATGTRASAGSSATQSLLATPSYAAPGAGVPARPSHLNAQARFERQRQQQAQVQAKALMRDNKNLRPGEKEAQERAKQEKRAMAAKRGGSGHTADQKDPENLELSLAQLMSRARTEAAQPAALPPVLRCLPGRLPGNSACLPAGSAALMGDALPPWCFEVRAPMKMGRFARHHVTVAGDACTGPPGNILLSPSTMHVLGAAAEEEITLRRVPGAPQCERLVLEAAASAAVDTAERRDALEAAVRTLLTEEANGYCVLSKGEVFQVQSRGHKCRVVDVFPSSPALMPPREIVFKQAKPAAAAAAAASGGDGGDGVVSTSQEELSVAPDHPASLRIVTSGQDASARLRVAATGGGPGATWILRLAVRTRGRAAAPLAPAVLYVTRGDTPPTVKE
eukprot:Rhum_TRINITY_DN10456_c0_g1::Rhum_TRINITY_DN10456_c0_g1_i1::g.38519::m.38519